jgi:ElaB/YqjD/DUF883 family membrane-anchored ribosome-binding protein
MALIRRDLHEDVREVVASAEAVTDWRRYIRSYPWAAVGIGLAVGYLIVPKRRQVIPPDVATQSDVAKVREVVSEAAETVKEHPRKSLLAGALGLLTPVAVRALQGYALRYIEDWIANLHEQQMATAGGRSPVPPNPPGSSARPEGGPGF